MNDLKRINGKTCLTKKYPEMLFGYAVIVICKHYNGEQKRKHHKRRINKKWLKRYGVWSGEPLNKGQVIIADGALLVSRPVYRQIKQAVKSQSIDPSSMHLSCNPESDQSKWIEKLKSFASPPHEKSWMEFIPYSGYTLPEADKIFPGPKSWQSLMSHADIERRIYASRYYGLY